MRQPADRLPLTPVPGSRVRLQRVADAMQRFGMLKLLRTMSPGALGRQEGRYAVHNLAVLTATRAGTLADGRRDGFRTD
jgi:hypothetical protein